MTWSYINELTCAKRLIKYQLIIWPDELIWSGWFAVKLIWLIWLSSRFFKLIFFLICNFNLFLLFWKPKYCQLIFQTNVLLCWPKILSINFSMWTYLNLIFPVDFTWSFDIIYFMWIIDFLFLKFYATLFPKPKYCQLIFQTNAWISWAKVLSINLSDK